MADIRKRNSGGNASYQVRYADPSKKTGFAYKSFCTRKLAQNFCAKKQIEEQELLTGIGVRTDIRSVAQAIDLWLDICERVGRDGREPIEYMTLIEYRRRAGVMMRYSWSKPVQDLITTDIVAFRTWLLETVSRDLAKRTLSSFHSVLLEMKLQGIIRDDPAAGVTIRSGGRYETEDSEIQIPSDQEVRDILAAADDMGKANAFMEQVWARYRPLIYLSAFSGMRSSEIRGLPWENLHADRVEIKQRADARGAIGPVKSRAGRRTVELSRRTTDLIFEWQDRCPASDANLVFPTSNGRPIPANNIRLKAWLPLLRKVGLTEMDRSGARAVERPRYTPHALRHYYASKLIEKKKDAKFIQERMGHSSIEITFNVYGHLMKDRQDAHRQTAEELADDLMPI